MVVCDTNCNSANLLSVLSVLVVLFSVHMDFIEWDTLMTFCVVAGFSWMIAEKISPLASTLIPIWPFVPH